MKQFISQTFLSIFIILNCSPILCQEEQEKQLTLARYSIHKGTDNDKDISQILQDKLARTFIYAKNDGQFYMSNFWEKDSSQSSGKISFVVCKREVFPDGVHTTSFMFSWSYKNSYNDDTGVATVKLVNILQDKVNYISLYIILENSRTIHYEGVSPDPIHFLELLNKEKG